jgi:hypothetical protein
MLCSATYSWMILEGASSSDMAERLGGKVRDYA